MNRFVRIPIALFVLCVMLLGLSACALTQSSSEEATVCATVMEIEKFGHAVLDVTTADLIANGYALGDLVCVRLDSYEADMPFYDGYYTNPGTVMLRGRTPESNIAICINYGDFPVKQVQLSGIVLRSPWLKKPVCWLFRNFAPCNTAMTGLTIPMMLFTRISAP